MMINKKLTKLVGLKKEEFDYFLQTGQIQVQPAKLIPTLKTGDEMALTSIFLSTLKLVKEYRAGIFKELKLHNGGKVFYYTEASFPEIDKSRIDGLIIVVISGIIKDAAFFEMKNKNCGIEAKKIETYLSISKKLGVNKLVTVSNEFVADSSHSPINIRVPKNISLYHFSWTYLLTKGQLLLFKNEDNIKDEDQVEIMREVLEYMESPLSGVRGYTQMKPGWKELAENVRDRKPLKISDTYIEDAIISWHEEEKDMALLMSRKLGVLVKSSPKGKESTKNDIYRLVKENCIKGKLSVKDSVSDINIIVDLEMQTVSMSIKVTPPLDKGTLARITWIGKQLENCKMKSESVYNKIAENIWIDTNIKYAQTHLRVKLSELGMLPDSTKGKEIQAFHIVLINSFGSRFASNKKFIELIEKMVLDYYESIVQHMTNWNRPAPRLIQVN